MVMQLRPWIGLEPQNFNETVVGFEKEYFPGSRINVSSDDSLEVIKKIPVKYNFNIYNFGSLPAYGISQGYKIIYEERDKSILEMKPDKIDDYFSNLSSSSLRPIMPKNSQSISFEYSVPSIYVLAIFNSNITTSIKKECIGCYGHTLIKNGKYCLRILNKPCEGSEIPTHF